ncbi:MAG: sodium/proline symporter [Peptococcaceae bacterium]|nr:sodium/proline symporter [Peptococcaceae bacterium]
MNAEVILIMITIFVYLAGMLWIGFYCAKRNDNTSEFFLGGRKMGPLVTAMSAEASDMSSYLLMGLPGLAYLSGFAHVGWTVIGLVLGTYFNWLFTAKRLRRYTYLTDSFTFPQFLSNRFHDHRNILGFIAAIIIIIFFVPYTASGFAACGKLFVTLFGANYTATMLIFAVVLIAYTASGGFLAASLTDFVQSIIMSIAILFVVVFAIMSAGGWGAVMDHVGQLPGYLSMVQSYVPDSHSSTPFGVLAIITTLSWGLGYFGMPHILLRFMAIEDENKLALSRRVASIWVIIAMAFAVLIGVAGLALSDQGIIPDLVGAGTETVIIQIGNYLSGFGPLATIMTGIIISGILASTMSTTCSQLLAASSSVCQDILQDKFGVQLRERQRMVLARLTVIVISLIGIYIARNPDSSIFGIVSFAWAGFGASFGPLVICALYWKRTTFQGAVAGTVVGGVAVFVWKYLIAPMGGVFEVYELLPAFLLGLATIIIVSLLTPAPSVAITDEFDKAASNEPL